MQTLTKEDKEFLIDMDRTSISPKFKPETVLLLHAPRFFDRCMCYTE